MWPYVEGSIDQAAFDDLVASAYSGFPLGRGLSAHRPWRQTITCSTSPRARHWRFKDVALQLLGRLLDHELERRGERVVVITATSGDTGSAAIEALAGRSNVAAVVLHPHERVSDVQRRQMTTVDAANIEKPGSQGNLRRLPRSGQGRLRRPGPQRRVSPGCGETRSTGLGSWPRSSTTSLPPADVAPYGGPVSFTVPTGKLWQHPGWLVRQAHGLGRGPTRRLPRTATTYSPATSKPVSCGPPMFSRPSARVWTSRSHPTSKRLLWEASGRRTAQR